MKRNAPFTVQSFQVGVVLDDIHMCLYDCKINHLKTWSSQKAPLICSRCCSLGQAQPVILLLVSFSHTAAATSGRPKTASLTFLAMILADGRTSFSRIFSYSGSLVQDSFYGHLRAARGREWKPKAVLRRRWEALRGHRFPCALFTRQHYRAGPLGVGSGR